ncbi:MAG: threonylcarbamoyl-AMP synthase [Prevotellaceae bacterium]|jgi:L-threonylcarbamoyladenylate synthase|nr:threonylcarbamoyl-AMP synthase [Prevotellaceae bacterium]
MMNNFDDDIKNCLAVLRTGGVILYPTDTIWGIGCDATNEAAVHRVFEIKQRQDSKALVLLADSATRIANYVEEVPDIAYDLIEVADKPLTIVYPNARNIAQAAVANDNSVAFRVPADAFCSKLCAMLRKPVVSTSANISGAQSPANFSEIADEIKEKVDYIVKFRQDENGKSLPSSIIKLDKGNVFSIIRK